MEKWKKKNVFRVLLYAVLYAVGTTLVCVTGAITPVLFVCYQITAGILLSGIVIYAFRKIKKPGVAACLALGELLLLVLIGDAVIGTVFMTFSCFGYYGQIWFNRDYTYECDVEEMPAGYADALMEASPGWSLVVVVIAGIVLSVIVSNVTAKLFKLER